MNFWNEQKLKEALPSSKFYNFPPDWNGSGLIIWYDMMIDNAFILIRRTGETRGVLPSHINLILDKVSAILCTNAVEYFKYNKPIVELKCRPGTAIVELARYIRKNYYGKVIAVTGSSGKTTTTKLVYDILSSKAKTCANLNKFNTTWGLSWNMTCFEQDAPYWVIETSLGGGMSRNSAITKPHYAIVTNIAPVHIKEGMSIIDIANEKSKIFNSMEEGACAIIYREALHYDILKKAAEYKGLKIITYGESSNCDIQITQNSFIIEGHEYELNNTPTAKHIMLDMAAAIAVAREENLQIEDAIEVLKNFSLVEGRGNLVKLSIFGKNITLIDESYNANPLSMKAAIEGFSKLYENKNKVLILGDMAECGADSKKFHIELAESVRQTKARLIVLCGNEMQHLFLELKGTENCIYYKGFKELNKAITNQLNSDDYVMIKSSNSSGLHTTVQVLKEAG